MAEIEIRNNPKFKSFFRNITELSFTSVVWGMWVYMFLPILNIILWLLGVSYFHVEVIEKVGYKELLDLLNKMGWSVLAVFIILRLWGYYNYRRFGKKDRRRSLSTFAAEQFARYFQIPHEQIEKLRSRKEVVWPIQEDIDKDVADWLSKSKSNSPRDSS